MEKNNDFHGQLKLIRRSYDSALLLREHGDVDGCLALTASVVRRLQHLINDLKNKSQQNKAYLDVLIDGKLASLSSDQHAIEALFKESEKNKVMSAPEQLDPLLERLEESIYVLKKELDVMAPPREKRVSPAGLLKKNRTAAAAVVIVAAFMSVGYFSIRHLSARKHALLGSYYRDREFTDLYKTRLDPTINFNWGYEPPMWGFRADTFAVRWTGFLKVPKSGRYEFTTQADDGVVLWVNDQKIIEDWSSHLVTTNTGSIDLEEGLVPIKLDYYEDNAAASVKLLWRYESEPAPTIIESAYFQPNR